MGQSKIKQAKGEPRCVVYVMCAVGIKIYSTEDPDTAKDRAVGIVRECLKEQDSDVFIPRAVVLPWGASQEEVEQMMKTLVKS
mgnify:FL=1